MRLPIMSVQRKKRVEPRDGILKAIIQERRILSKGERLPDRKENREEIWQEHRKKAARRNYFTCCKEKGELEKSI